jgi:hypothetical protein
MKNSFRPILTYIIPLLIIGVHSSCQETIKSPKEAIDEPQEKVVGNAQNGISSYDSVDSVYTLEEIDRKALPFNGLFLSALSWNDKLGNNILILSEKGTYDNGNGRKELFAYHYVKRDTSYDVLWQINDFVDGSGCDLSIELIKFFPLISDVDSNGIAETAIFYSLDSRCDAGSFPAKLIIHEGANKVAIRGIRAQFLGPPEEVNNKYRAEMDLPPVKYKNLDTGSSLMDDLIVNYYSHQWDNFISLENKLEGTLPDSLLIRIN